MEDLHAAIADYLRDQRRIDAEDTETLHLLHERHRAHLAASRCNVCGRPVDDDGGLFNLADMQLRRQCVKHYVPF